MYIRFLSYMLYMHEWLIILDFLVRFGQYPTVVGYLVFGCLIGLSLSNGIFFPKRKNARAWSDLANVQMEEWRHGDPIQKIVQQIVPPEISLFA